MVILQSILIIFQKGDYVDVDCNIDLFYDLTWFYSMAARYFLKTNTFTTSNFHSFWLKIWFQFLQPTF